MSLLNDMLSDLDRATPRLTPLKANQSTSSHKSPVQRYWLPCLAVIAVLYFLFVELDVLGFTSKNGAVINSIPGPIEINKKWVGVDLSSSKDSLSQLESTSRIGEDKIKESSQMRSLQREVNVKKTVSVDEDKKNSLDVSDSPNSDSVIDHSIDDEPISILLTQAFELLDHNHLMTPVENNAYQYFNAVIAIDAENKAALDGIERIYRRYLQLATKAFEQGREAKGDLFLQRAEVIAPIAQSELLKIRGIDNTPSDFIEDLSSVNGEGELNIVVSSNFSDIKLAAMIRKRFIPEHEEQVVSRLNNGDVMNASVIALADHYASNKSNFNLSKLHSEAKNEAAKGYISAKLAVLDSNFTLAQRELESVRFNDPANDQWRVRLLSAACQKNKDFECAVSGYSRLVSSSSRQVNDWLGLAVSFDGQGNVKSALNAYKNVVDLIPSENRVSHFARQRISDLSSMSYNR